MAQIRGFGGRNGYYSTYGVQPNRQLGSVEFQNELGALEFGPEKKRFNQESILFYNGFYADQYRQQMTIDQFCNIIKTYNFDELSKGVIPEDFFDRITDSESLATRSFKAFVELYSVLYGFMIGNSSLIDGKPEIEFKPIQKAEITAQPDKSTENKLRWARYMNYIYGNSPIMKPYGALLCIGFLWKFRLFVEEDAFPNQWAFFPCIFCFLLGYVCRSQLKPDPMFRTIGKVSSFANSYDLQAHIFVLCITFAMFSHALCNVGVHYYILYFIGLYLKVEVKNRPPAAKTAQEIQQMTRAQYDTYIKNYHGNNYVYK